MSQPHDGLGCYVYAVVDVEATLPEGLVGLDEAPLRLVASGPVAAVVADVALDRGPGRRRELVAHSTVVDGLAAETATVPVQFGSMVPDEASVVEQFLAPQQDVFAAQLEQLRGRRQYTLRASYHEEAALAEVVQADPEVAELRRRTRELPEEEGYALRVRLGELVAQAMEAKRAEDTAVLLDAVAPYVVATVPHAGGGLDHVADVAVLVDDERAPELEQHLEGLAEAVHERLRLRLVGPTAAYDFVDGG